jgi:hypothetical protein
MRLDVRAICIAALIAASPAVAQQWLDYVNREYRFAVNFPVAPAEQATMHRSSDGRTLPARTFLARQGTNVYRVTVVPFPAGAADAAAEIAHAASLVRPKGQAIFDARGDYDGVPAQDINLIDPMGRQIMAAILFHDRRLYIVEGDVAADAAPPIQFQQSIHITDADGKPLNLEQAGRGGR